MASLSSSVPATPNSATSFLNQRSLRNLQITFVRISQSLDRGSLVGDKSLCTGMSFGFNEKVLKSTKASPNVMMVSCHSFDSSDAVILP